MVTSDAKTPDELIAALPEDRREAVREGIGFVTQDARAKGAGDP